jgi:hypothetical protein
MKAKTQEQQKIVHPVVLLKTFSPQENRVKHAKPVEDYGQQKESSASVPIHNNRVSPVPFGASGKSAAFFYAKNAIGAIFNRMV